MRDVLDNKPISANINELLEPDRPSRLPATDKSWHGKPAVISNVEVAGNLGPAPGKHASALLIRLAEGNGTESD